MSFGGGAPTPDVRAKNIMAKISAGQRDIYNKNYLPIQQLLQQEVSNPNFISKLQRNATQQIGIGAEGSKGAAQRTRQRFGIQSTPLQQAALDRRFNLAKANLTTNAANQAGRQGYKAITQGMAGVTDIGHGVASRSLQTANSMARLEANRNSANAGISAQDKAGTMSAIGTGVGIAAAFL